MTGGGSFAQVDHHQGADFMASLPPPKSSSLAVLGMTRVNALRMTRVAALGMTLEQGSR